MKGLIEHSDGQGQGQGEGEETRYNKRNRSSTRDENTDTHGTRAGGRHAVN